VSGSPVVERQVPTGFHRLAPAVYVCDGRARAELSDFVYCRRLSCQATPIYWLPELMLIR